MLNNPTINMATLRVACSNCNLRELCLPLGLTLKEIERLEELVSTRKRVRRGEALYRAGDRFDALYAIRLGFLKSAVTSSDGREQVTSFHMSGDIVGLDGLAGMVYSSDLIALEDTEVCILPYDKLLEVTQNMFSMSQHFQKLLAMEIVRQNGVNVRKRSEEVLMMVAYTSPDGSYSPTELADYESMYVMIENTQLLSSYSDMDSWSSSDRLSFEVDGSGESYDAFVPAASEIAADAPSLGSGSISGIVVSDDESSYLLMLSSRDDVAGLDGERFESLLTLSFMEPEFSSVAR